MIGGRSVNDSDRGVSTVAGYVTTLAVMTMLTTSLLIAGGDFVQDQREVTVREELKVIGQGLSGDITAAERLGTAGDDGTGAVTVRRSFPTEAAGTDYRVTVTDSGGEPRLILTTRNPSVTVTVPVSLTEDTSPNAGVGLEGTVVVENTVSGGDLVVEFTDVPESDPNEVTVRNV